MKKEFILTPYELVIAISRYIGETRPGSLPMKQDITFNVDINDERVKLFASWGDKEDSP